MERRGDAFRAAGRTPGAALAALALLWAAAPSGPAAGQATAPPGASGPEMDAAAVLLAPLSDLTPGDATGGGLQLSSSVGVRVAGIWWLGPRLGVAAGGSWVPVDVDRLASTDPGGDPVPGGRLAAADYLTGSVEAVLSLPPVGPEVEVEPYLLGGVGLRRLSVEGQPDGAPTATDPMVAVGGGFRTVLSDAWLLRLEARDQISRYDGGGGDGRVQHDLTVSVGVGVRP